MSRYSADHAGEALDLVIDREVHLAAAIGRDVVVGQQFGHALNGGERRAHFVADQRDHVVLGLLQLVLARDVAQRGDDAEHRADAVLVGGDRGQPQRVVARLRRIAECDLALDAAALFHQARQRAGVHRAVQPLRSGSAPPARARPIPECAPALRLANVITPSGSAMSRPSSTERSAKLTNLARSSRRALSSLKVRAFHSTPLGSQPRASVTGPPSAQ